MSRVSGSKRAGLIYGKRPVRDTKLYVPKINRDSNLKPKDNGGYILDFMKLS